MTPLDVYNQMQQYVNQYVELTLYDGRTYNGYVVNVDHENVTLQTEQASNDQTPEQQDQRFFPAVTVPLAFIAGAAFGHHHPYPYPYPYPYPVYPYGYPTYPVYPVYPYPHYPFGYPYTY